MAHDVFVSYSSKDQRIADTAVTALERAGIRCWIAPRDVKAGAVWAQSIVDAIGECKVFLLIFSANANRSGHIVNEVDAAVRKGAVVVPFRVENVAPEGAMEYHLRTRHWLDAMAGDLATHVDELVETVRRLLQDRRPVSDLTGFMELATAPGPRPASAPPASGASPPVNSAPAGPPKARPAFERTDSGFHIKVPRPALGRRRLLGVAGAAVLLTSVWLLRRQPDTIRVPFEYRSESEGNQLSVRLTVDALRFFEGPVSPPRERSYSTSFVAAQTRYIHTEIVLKLAAPGRPIVVPIGCDVYTATGAVFGSFTIESTITAGATQWFNSRPLGAERVGSWKPGRYRIDCRYGSKLVARGRIEVLG